MAKEPIHEETELEDDDILVSESYMIGWHVCDDPDHKFLVLKVEGETNGEDTEVVIALGVEDAKEFAEAILAALSEGPPRIQ